MKNIILFACLFAAISAFGVNCNYTVVNDKPEAVYKVGEKAKFIVTATDTKGKKIAAGTVNVTLDNFGPKVILSEKIDLAKENPFTVEGTLGEPGFLRLMIDEKKCLWSVGFDPERIEKGSSLPADFDKFWADARAKLDKTVPIDAKIVRVPERCTSDFEFYRTSFATFGRRIHGYISVPTDKSIKEFPVHVQVAAAGFGGWTNDMKGRKDRISVFFSVYPWAPHWQWGLLGLQNAYDYMNTALAVKYGPKVYSCAGIGESRESEFFYPVIVGIDRAVDWIAANYPVDRKNFVYSGTSQGGGFGIYLAALNSNFTKAAFMVPALTDVMGYKKGRMSGWPRFTESQADEKSRVNAEKFAPYFDAANFASRIKCPVRFSVGFADVTCPPPAVYATYNEVKVADKKILHGLGMSHSCRAEFYEKVGKWLMPADTGCNIAGRDMNAWLDTPFLTVVPMGFSTEDLVKDAEWLYWFTPINSIAYWCTLVPEGNPPTDKAAELAADIRKKMDAVKKVCPLRHGIMFQATMGHGWTPSERTPWQKVVKQDGSSMYKFCPLGKEFLAHMEEQAKKLADIGADYFMVDDDTRLITWVNGCYCPLHLEEFGRRTGRKWTRTELVEAIAKDDKIHEAWDTLLSDSIAPLMERIRSAFPRDIPGMFCCCQLDTHHAARMAKILAAPGQRPIVRINNGTYLSDSLRDSINRCASETARQIADIGYDVTILDESDTCPHNRYSTSATRVLNHFALAAMEGVRGAKIWITNPLEHRSRKAYRDMFREYRGYIETLAQLNIRRDGLVVPLPKKRPLRCVQPVYPHDWGVAYLGRAGFPYRTGIARKGDVVAMLAGDVQYFNDDELKQFLAGPLVLDGAAAVEFVRRGFAKEIGVNAKPWSGKTITAEDYGKVYRGGTVNSAADLRDRNPKSKELSKFYHKVSGSKDAPEYLAPGTIMFDNELGGKVLVLAPYMPRYVGLQQYVYYTEARKEQLAELFKMVNGGKMPGRMYYCGDAPMMCQSGVAADGTDILFLDNVDLDTVDGVELGVSGGKVKSFERLAGDGTWHSVSFKQVKDIVTLYTAVETLRPAVFRFKFESDGK